MKYLIKDLCQQTQFSPARVRKWQERFQILQPERGENGYWYYTEQDLTVLRNIQRRLAAGQKLNSIMARGRQEILATDLPDHFAPEDWTWFQWIKDNNYESIQHELEKRRKEFGFQAWIQNELQPLVELVGLGWQSNYITVAEEHSFSRWFQSYLMQSCIDLPVKKKTSWLICTMPGDEHELGALMHYALLRDRGYKPEYTGMLPRTELKKYLRMHRFDRVSISITTPVTRQAIIKLQLELLNINPDMRVYFGGSGLRNDSKKRQLESMNDPIQADSANEIKPSNQHMEQIANVSS